MLALKLGLSLVSNRKLGGWLPTNETSIEAWYQKGEGIDLNGSDVSTWADSSSNGIDMVQTAEVTEQPAYSEGVLTFVSADDNNLQTTGQISLTGDFTIGLRVNVDTTNGVILGNNTIVDEFMKFSGADILRVKIDGSIKDLSLDSGVFGDDYLVLTRASNVLTLWRNGDVQADTETLAGTSDIDAIGIRYDTTNGYDGTIEEIQIYSSASAALTTNVNNRLSTL